MLQKFANYYNWKLQDLRHDVTKIIKSCKVLTLKTTKFKERFYKNYWIFKVLQLKTTKFKTWCYKNYWNLKKYCNWKLQNIRHDVVKL